MDNYPSKLLEKAVFEFSKLPGIGNKTALRLVLHLLKQDLADVDVFSRSILELKQEVRHCQVCRNISDHDVCEICSNTKRDHSTICVVENIKDVMTIENTHHYQGVYHVLGGIISPMDGIGPDDLEIDSLTRRFSQDVKEVIFALRTTMEGDTTNFYLYKKLSQFENLKITTLARGVAFGDELEYTDELTLGRSIQNRLNFDPGNGI
jgi:recombination protein RecR